MPVSKELIAKALEGLAEDLLPPDHPDRRLLRPKAEVIAGPWPQLSEQQKIRNQLEIDKWWSLNRDKQAQAAEDPDPDERLRAWIWGKTR
jgi:hypothetical protein